MSSPMLLLLSAAAAAGAPAAAPRRIPVAFLLCDDPGRAPPPPPGRCGRPGLPAGAPAAGPSALPPCSPCSPPAPYPAAATGEAASSESWGAAGGAAGGGAAVDADSDSDGEGGGRGARAPRRRWKAWEDAALVSAVGARGPGRWNEVAAGFPGRNGRQVRLRWMNHLQPSVDKAAWRRDEDAVVLEAQRELGNRWSAIAGRLAGRTDNSVKNRFKSLQRRRVRERRPAAAR